MGLILNDNMKKITSYTEKDYFLIVKRWRRIGVIIKSLHRNDNYRFQCLMSTEYTDGRWEYNSYYRSNSISDLCYYLIGDGFKVYIIDDHEDMFYLMTHNLLMYKLWSICKWFKNIISKD